MDWPGRIEWGKENDEDRGIDMNELYSKVIRQIQAENRNCSEAEAVDILNTLSNCDLLLMISQVFDDNYWVQYNIERYG